MISLKQTLTSSLYALLGQRAPAQGAAAENRAEDIREAMLALLPADDDGLARLARRVEYASDIQALWFLRSDLLAALARTDGEAAARGKVEAVSGMFKGVLPQGLRSRSHVPRHSLARRR